MLSRLSSKKSVTPPPASLSSKSKSNRAMTDDYKENDDGCVEYDVVCGPGRDRDSPAVYNNTRYPIVVFLERGVLYSKQVLRPGEAVSMTREQTGGFGGPVPRSVGGYKVHAVIGDETAIPTKRDSLKNVARVSIVPAAFVAGCLMTASSAGTMAGPSAGLSRLVSGAVLKRVVFDKAAIAAGTLAAGQAQRVSEAMLSQHREQLVCVTPNLKPGRKYLSVSGGLSEGPVVIEDVGRRKFKKFKISAMKTPIVSKEEQDKRKALMASVAASVMATKTKAPSQRATVTPTAPMAPTAAPTTTWSCPDCTLVNSDHAPVCAACQRANPAAGTDVGENHHHQRPSYCYKKEGSPMVAQTKKTKNILGWTGRKKSVKKVAAEPSSAHEATVY